MAIQDLKGPEKASLLLMALGTSASAQVFKHLTESEIEKLCAEIVRMREIDRETVEGVLAEFVQTSAGAAQSPTAGREFASLVLAQAVGEEDAGRILQKAAHSVGAQPFEFLWETEPAGIVEMLAQEDPQIVALVLTNLPPEKGAAVLSEFPEETQPAIALRICSMEPVERDVLTAIEEALQLRAETSPEQAKVTAGGPKALIDILNNSERSTERIILEGLKQQDAEMGEQVRGMLFIFEDLLKLDDRTVQSVIREIDQEDIRLAVKGADDSIKELVFRNMSERAAEALKEDLELLGQVKVKDVEAAQQRIVGLVRRLLASGEISLAEPEEEQAAEAQAAEEQTV